MLSSFASFLPAALHLNPQPDLPRPAVNPDTEDEEEPEVHLPPQTVEKGPQPPGKGKEKDKTANEVRYLFRDRAGRQRGRRHTLDARFRTSWLVSVKSQFVPPMRQVVVLQSSITSEKRLGLAWSRWCRVSALAGVYRSNHPLCMLTTPQAVASSPSPIPRCPVTTRSVAHLFSAAESSSRLFCTAHLSESGRKSNDRAPNILPTIRCVVTRAMNPILSSSRYAKHFQFLPRMRPTIQPARLALCYVA